MFWVTRIFELLSATKKLNDSKTHIMSAATHLILLLLLGMFGILLSALMVSGLLYLIYAQLLLSGFSVVVAVLYTAGLTVAILAIIGLMAASALSRIHASVEDIFRSQSPIVAPVVNKVSNVASSFLAGLRTSHGVPHNAKLIKSGDQKRVEKRHR